MINKQRASGFYVWNDYEKGVPGLGVDTDRIDECVAYYKEKRFGGWFGTPSFGFNQDNLEFLHHTRDVKWMWFWDVSLKSIDALYELTNLENIGIHPKRPGIDFSRLRSLRYAFNHWNKADVGLPGSTITDYHLWHYKPRSKTFDGLEIPSGVEKLELCWANPADLNGLPVMKKLKALEIHRCRNLHDLSALPRIAPNLQELLTTTSGKLEPTAGVLDHPKLKTALISGKFFVGTTRHDLGDGG